METTRTPGGRNSNTGHGCSRKHRPQRHQPYDRPTWGQIKTLTNQVKNLISQQGMPQSPETLWLCSVGLRPPTQAGLTNLLTQPPSISGHKKDGEKTQHINQGLHPHAPSLEPSHPGEEGKLINLSLGYEVLPVPGPRKIIHKHTTTNLGFRPASKRLSYIAALFLSVNHVYY